MTERDIRTHEVTFCSRVSKWADSIFENNPALSFKHTDIEESKGIKRKRSDLRVYGANNKLILAGEVKLPGTAEGRNAYNSALVEDSYKKASNAGAEFFFTWNVNKFVLFDSKKWQLPIIERRVKDYDLGLDLDDPDDVSRAEGKRLTYPSFLPLRLVLGFPTMQDNHHREARDDQGRATDSMVQCYREPIKKRAEHCGLLS